MPYNVAIPTQRGIKTLRESDIFPFLAVKAADYPKEEYKFSASMKEKLATLNRQQMCVFEQAKDRIRFVNKEICVGNKHEQNRTDISKHD